MGAALGAYDGYKYAKKKKLKGWKKAAAIAGGAPLGAINSFKVVKAATKVGKLAKNGVKAAKALKNGKKAGKLVKNGVKAAKALKNGNKLTKAAKATKAGKLKVVKPNKKLANNRYNKATNKAAKKASENLSEKRARILKENKIKGRAYEIQEFAKFKVQYPNAVEQVTIKTASGRRTRIDALAVDDNGNYILREYKSSHTAPVRENQELAFNEILESGGEIVGKWSKHFQTRIPPGVEVKIIRPD